jgi:hypothetical protein
MDMKSYNLSTLFALPLIQSEDSYIEKENLITDSLINTYLRDPKFPMLQTVIAVYKGNNKHLDNFSRTEGKITSMNGLVTYHITFNEKLQKEYQKILKGEYSELSNQAKNNIADFWNTSSKYSFINGILYKTKFAKYLYLQSLNSKGITPPRSTSFEYWYKPSMIKETIQD